MIVRLQPLESFHFVILVIILFSYETVVLYSFVAEVGPPHHILFYKNIHGKNDGIKANKKNRPWKSL